MQYKKTLLSFITSASVAMMPLVSFAQIENPLKSITSIPEFVSTVLSGAVKVGGVIAIFAFIYSGYRFVEARGNPDGLETAKQIFINTCIGVAILLGAQLIASLIVGTISNLKS